MGEGVVADEVAALGAFPCAGAAEDEEDEGVVGGVGVGGEEGLVSLGQFDWGHSCGFRVVGGFFGRKGRKCVIQEVFL